MFRELSDEQAGKLIKCLMSNGDASHIDDGMVRVAHASLITTINRDNEKYEQRCEKNRENVNIRWNKENTTVYDRIPANTKHTDSDSDSDKNPPTPLKPKRKKKNFTPPSKEDVIKYFAEKGYSKQAGEKAFDYYQEASWKDSHGKPVLNWKQKMIAVWFKPENENGSIEAKPFKQFKPVWEHDQTRYNPKTGEEEPI